MSKNQFTGTATQPQRNRNATANYVNLIRTNTVYDVELRQSWSSKLSLSRYSLYMKINYDLFNNNNDNNINNMKVISHLDIVRSDVFLTFLIDTCCSL